MSESERILARARALMQNRGMTRGDAFAMASASVRRPSVDDDPRRPTPLRCHCGAVALVYDEERGYCGPHYPIQ